MCRASDGRGLFLLLFRDALGLLVFTAVRVLQIPEIHEQGAEQIAPVKQGADAHGPHAHQLPAEEADNQYGQMQVMSLERTRRLTGRLLL